MLRSKLCHIFGTGRPTNFKLGTEIEHKEPYYDKRHDFQVQKSRSKDHVVPLIVVGP